MYYTRAAPAINNFHHSNPLVETFYQFSEYIFLMLKFFLIFYTMCCNDLWITISPLVIGVQAKSTHRLVSIYGQKTKN